MCRGKLIIVANNSQLLSSDQQSNHVILDNNWRPAELKQNKILQIDQFMLSSPLSEHVACVKLSMEPNSHMSGVPSANTDRTWLAKCRKLVGRLLERI